MESSYTKYAYFLTPEELKEIEARLKSEGRRLYKARRMVCELLHPKRVEGVAGPEVWSKICKHQGSWYYSSSQAGRFLLVGNFQIPVAGGVEIRPVEFQPPRQAAPKEIEEMVQCPDYQKMKPEEWDNITPWDIEQFRLFRQGLLKLGLASKEEAEENFYDVFPSHCANHANFICPEFYLEEEGEKVPYTIAPTLRICSACLELFGLIGADFHKKLVVLCPGAVVVTGLPKDVYFSVQKIS